ncbi:hypothetical protein [Lentibacillus sp. CBA3610]|uniref:hypothetical protein n=1 Tax=Lentibacillus sp. CBA3610 TaxID=2518176 RepID=UPI001594F0F4|nr:hypothetical protein [Lentibacillus sp. CBA3610]QKY69153.1 hypothetical protein Len3610_05600 [Lentibacillus sp. CBA3610]
MFLFEDEANIVQDREDLLSILKMRFGDIPPKIIEAIYDVKSYETLERLILVASNVPNFKVFLEELEEGEGSFRILGDRFNPIEAQYEGDGSGEKKHK